MIRRPTGFDGACLLRVLLEDLLGQEVTYLGFVVQGLQIGVLQQLGPIVVGLSVSLTERLA